MLRLTVISQWTVRLTGIVQVVSGLLFWTGRALTFRPPHMLIGMVFVLALWVLVGIATRAGLRYSRAALAAAWGLVIPVFGATHARLLPGPNHWVIRLVHLLIGIVAMVIAARLARFVREHPRSKPRSGPEIAGAWRRRNERAVAESTLQDRAIDADL